MTERVHTGLELLEAEMARQQADATASWAANRSMAKRIAEALAKPGRLLLVGMGASHYANRIVEPCFRRLGIDAWAITAAEFLRFPPPGARTVMLVSQSGESGEIVQILKQTAKLGQDAFGLTLDAGSTLGRALPCLAGTGGGEIAFAATRSLTVTLALHAAVLAALEPQNREACETFDWPTLPNVGKALRALAGAASIVVTGTGALRGLAEANALMVMELARMPAFGFEFGQFRHGPLELLSPQVGVLILRDRTDEAAGLAATAVAAGCPTVVFDCSGKAALPGVATVAFAPAEDLRAAMAMLPALQRLIVDLSAQKVERVGEPVRSTKITRETA